MREDTFNRICQFLYSGSYTLPAPVLEPLGRDASEHELWENHANVYYCHMDIYLYARQWDMETLCLYGRAHLQLLAKTQKPLAGRVVDLVNLIWYAYANVTKEQDKFLLEMVTKYAADSMKVHRSWRVELHDLSTRIPEFASEFAWQLANILP